MPDLLHWGWEAVDTMQIIIIKGAIVMKKLLSAILAASMVLAMGTTAFAAQADPTDGDTLSPSGVVNGKILNTTTPITQISATVPIAIEFTIQPNANYVSGNITVGKENVVTFGNGYKIVGGEDMPAGTQVQLAKIELIGTNNWKLIDPDSASTVKNDIKSIGITVNEKKFDENGVMTFDTANEKDSPKLGKLGELALAFAGTSSYTPITADNSSASTEDGTSVVAEKAFNILYTISRVKTA